MMVPMTTPAPSPSHGAAPQPRRWRRYPHWIGVTAFASDALRGEVVGAAGAAWAGPMAKASARAPTIGISLYMDMEQTPLGCFAGSTSPVLRGLGMTSALTLGDQTLRRAI